VASSRWTDSTQEPAIWVEVIDARGNTVGPKPAMSFTAPTVWVFYVAHKHEFAQFYMEQDDVTLPRMESTFGVTVDNLTIGSGWNHQVPTETQPVEMYAVEGLLGPC
jgi:hypothetical protein